MYSVEKRSGLPNLWSKSTLRTTSTMKAASLILVLNLEAASPSYWSIHGSMKNAKQYPTQQYSTQ